MITIVKNILLSGGITSMCFMILFIVGYPVSRFFVKRISPKHKEQVSFCLSFFIGYSLIAIILSNITNLNIPLKYSAYPFIILFIMIFIFDAYKNGIPKIFNYKYLLIFIAIVTLGAGIGYFLVGPYNYLGYRFTDIFFYVTQTEFHMNYPLHMKFDTVMNSPWMAYPINLSTMRIGRSMLQGLCAVLTSVDSEMTIGVIGLLSPVLTYIALYLYMLQINIRKYFKYLIPLFGALIPGFVSLNLECFLGASTAVPFIIISVIIYNYYLTNKHNIYTLILLSIIMAASSLIYSESILFIIIILFIMYIYYIIAYKCDYNKRISIFICIVLTLIINIAFIKSVYLAELGHSLTSGAYDGNIYINLQYGRGFVDMYLGLGDSTILIIIGECLYVFSIAGLLINFLGKYTIADLGFLVLYILHFAMLKIDSANTYSYYRLLLMALPLTPIGIYYIINYVIKCNSFLKCQNLMIKIIKIVFIVIFSFSILIGVYNSALPFLNPLSPKISFKENKVIKKQWDYLKNNSKNLYFVGGGDFVAHWSYYFGRNNSIWLNHPDVGFPYIPNGNFSFNDINSVPEDIEIFYDILAYNPVTNPNERSQLGVHIENAETHKLLTPGQDNKTHCTTYNVVIFSKLKGTCSVKFSFKEGNVQANYNGEELKQIENGCIEIQICLEKGINKVNINTGVSSSLKDYSVELVQ